jgi:malonate decarboxylase beta subunit
MGVADELVLDDVPTISAAVQRCVTTGLPQVHRSQQVDFYRECIAALDASHQIDPPSLRESWNKKTKKGVAR